MSAVCQSLHRLVGGRRKDSFPFDGKLIPSDGKADAFFGWSVSIVGNLVAVGARKDDLQGSVYLFRLNGQNWIEEAKLLATDGAIDDLFGHALDMDDEFIVVGASSASNENGMSTGPTTRRSSALHKRQLENTEHG